MSQPPDLKGRAVRRFFLTFGFLAGLLFLPAGTLPFWQAWLLLGLMFVFWTGFVIYLLKHDPKVLERRLQAKETDPAQKLFQRLFSATLFPAYILAGLDFHLGWSRSLGSVPLAVVLTAQALVVIGYCLVFWVMKTNTFAASIIQVESEQRVISAGPYAFVRHPMYSGMVLTALATPLALGSYIALPVFALMVPILIYRLMHEERFLRRDLPGYAEYCQRTSFRLIPWLW